MSWLSENADELAALSLVFAGIYLVITGKDTTGFSMISLGTAYLFGKHTPKKSVVPFIPGARIDDIMGG